MSQEDDAPRALPGGRVPDSARPDRGVLLGEGLFETLLVLDGRAPHVALHRARLERSAAALDMRWCGADLASWEDAISAAWAAAGRPRRAAARLTCAAEGPSGLAAPDVAGRVARTRVTVRPLPHAPDRTPWSAAIVSAHRVDPGARISGHKTLSWLPWVLARQEALERGADIALVTTVDGDVCEADHANLFAVLDGVRDGALVGGADGSGDGVVVTPPVSRGVLPGITRERVLRTLREAGRVVAEAPLTRDDLAAAREVFVSSSLGGVRSVGRIDDRDLPAARDVADWLAACVTVV